VCRLIGIPSTGGAGIINTIRSFAHPAIVTGVFCIIATVGWGIQTFGSLWLYRTVWAHKNDQGHNFNQARTEFQQQCVYPSRSLSSRSALGPLGCGPLETGHGLIWFNDSLLQIVQSLFLPVSIVPAAPLLVGADSTYTQCRHSRGT
jgi:hypothetical protein